MSQSRVTAGEQPQDRFMEVRLAVSELTIQRPGYPVNIVPSVGPGGLFTSGPVHCPLPAQLGWRQEVI